MLLHEPYLFIFFSTIKSLPSSQITELSEMIKQRLEIIGYNNFVIVAGMSSSCLKSTH